jgi:hypothetical protein
MRPNLEVNLQDLRNRITSGRYVAPPVWRAYILKADGSQRPLGIPTFEDKLAQRAIAMLLEPIYEQDSDSGQVGLPMTRCMCMPGAGLSGLMCGKAPPEMLAFLPYRGKPAVRNDREGRGNDGIIRSPGSRLDSTRLRGGDGDIPTYSAKPGVLHFSSEMFAWLFARQDVQPSRRRAP